MKIPAVTFNTEGAILTDVNVSGGSGGGGLGDYENVVVVAKAGADYSTVATGEAACAASDLLAVMPGVYNENVTLDVQFVTMLGFGGAKDSGIVQLSGSDDVGPILDLDNDVNVVWIYFNRTLTGGAGAYIAVDASGTYHTHFQQCSFDLDGGATGRAVTGLKIKGDGSTESTVVQCRIFMSNEGTGEAIDLAGNGVTIEGCEIDGDVVCSAATTTRIRSTRIDGDLTGVAGSDLYLQDVEVTGTISGWDSVTIEGAESDPGANARTLATNSDGQLTLQDLFLPASGTIGVDSGALITFTATGIVVNEAGIDRDLRVEGDTDPNLLFVDAGNDLIGIGTAAPSADLEVVGVMIINSNSDGGISFRIQRNSASGRSQYSLDDESGNSIWRAGLTGGGGTGYNFFDQTQNAFVLEQDGDILMNPGGNVGIGTTSPDTRLDIADGAMTFAEMTAPGAPAANGAVLFARDNGSSKTQLCVRFNTGAIQVLATEP